MCIVYINLVPLLFTRYMFLRFYKIFRFYKIMFHLIYLYFF
ncbi:hypothetical protein FPC840_480007 [Flavobacterium psychrophilum]|nr:hypothetical protein FPC840_480007 [Flavobacterium psychrophilum]